MPISMPCSGYPKSQAGRSGRSALKPTRRRSSLRRGGSTREAKRICTGCEVRGECPRVRAGARRALRHLGRHVRARAPPAQASRRLTSSRSRHLPRLVPRRVDLFVDVAPCASQFGDQLGHDHEDEVGAASSPSVARASIGRRKITIVGAVSISAMPPFRSSGAPAAPRGRPRRQDRTPRPRSATRWARAPSGKLHAVQLCGPVGLDLLDGVEDEIVESLAPAATARALRPAPTDREPLRPRRSRRGCVTAGPGAGRAWAAGSTQSGSGRRVVAAHRL